MKQAYCQRVLQPNVEFRNSKSLIGKQKGLRKQRIKNFFYIYQGCSTKLPTTAFETNVINVSVPKMLQILVFEVK